MTPEEANEALLRARGQDYPWGLCLWRFVKRLLLGLLVCLVFFVLVVMSALPYGGGASRELVYAWGITVPFLLMWAFAGFIPPANSWCGTVKPGVVAACACLAALAIALGAAGLRKLPGGEAKAREARVDQRARAIRLCSAELATLSAPLAVNSLLIDTGVVEQRMLRELLGGRGLRFVELRARAGEDWRTGQKTYGVKALDGRETVHFAVAPGNSIVRLSLSRKGDPACAAPAVLGLDHFLGKAPTAPDACLRVEFDQESQASHALKAIPAGSNPAFIKWAIVQQASGTVLAGLTSSDSAQGPFLQRGGARDEQKSIGDDTVSCRSPHYSLMGLVYGPARGKDERLSLGTRTVALDLGPTDLAGLASSETVEVDERAVEDWDARKGARSGPAWADAYAAAAQSGWAPYERGVIDFNAAMILAPRPLAKPSTLPQVRGSETGFMVAWGLDANSMALAQFGLDGSLLWKRRIASAHPVQDERARFGLVGMEWDRGQVRLYGFRSKPQPDAQGNLVDVRVLVIPLSGTAGLPAPR